ncbi:hypothetical protein LIER_11051 [Lithospermum erythrorhizon]|uniref:RRM domain-containing protein n=1 Tax=Lithospermum erythrorhizon TaxID=34254 RepID=A0AAV3PPH1_LITER
MTMSINNEQNMSDTKVFVGGLAWETQKETLRVHFEKYGEILEAVIILDKATARSKGYGFVTFKEPKAAKKACEDATPIINGRRANCNLASLGAKRPRAPTPSASPPPPQQGFNVGQARGNNVAKAANVGQVQWYYPTVRPTPIATPYLNRQPLHVYGYTPTYMTTDMGYNQHKMLGYTGGSYMNGHFSQVYPGQPMMPMYPFYPYYQSQTMGLPAHMYRTIPGPMTAVPPMIHKPTSIAPNPVCLAVE